MTLQTWLALLPCDLDQAQGKHTTFSMWNSFEISMFGWIIVQKTCSQMQRLLPAQGFGTNAPTHWSCPVNYLMHSPYTCFLQTGRH
jgi:hypothetical protein